MREPIIINEEEIEGSVVLSVDEYDGSVRLGLESDGKSVLPVFLRSYLPEERFITGFGSRSPFFFESMLREADIEFMYERIEAPPGTDRSYASMARCSLDAAGVQELIAQFNRISSVAMYDFWFRLDEQQLWFGDSDWLACRGTSDAVRQAAEVFADEH